MPHMRGMVTGAGRRSLVFATALLMAACSGTSSDATTTTTTSPPATTVATTTTSTTTTTIAPPATTTSADPLARPDVLVSNPNRSSIDDFDTTGDDLYRVVMELIDLFVYLEGHPTGTAEEMVSLVFEPEYPFYESILTGFRELTDNPGWHYVDAGDHTLGIELVKAHDGEATFRIAHEREDQVVADSNGNVVETYSGSERRVSSITFRRGPDGRWRYAFVEPSAPISDEELASMVSIEWEGRR